MGKWCLHSSLFFFVRIESSFLVNDCHLDVSPVTILILIIKVAGNQDRHKSLDEFDFGPLVSMAHLCVFWNGRMSSSACGWSKDLFLAHLTRRLTRWAYRMGLEPVSVRPSTLSNMNISETSRPITTKFYLKHHWGGGKAALGFHADQIRTLVSMATDSSHRVIMGEKGVITFSRLFLIGSFLYWQITMTYIRACMSLKFGQIRPRTTELAALERRKKFP